VFAQVPGHLDFFVGRILRIGETCADAKQAKRPWSIALFKMNWSTHSLDFQKEVFQPRIQISAGPATTETIRSAADPSVALYNGELWVAFECARPKIRGASTCVGPFDLNAASIDPRRTTLAIKGGTDVDPASSLVYSASAPNLFVFHDRLYVYWSAIAMERTTLAWEQITIRGIQLEQERSGLRRLWGLGSAGAPVASHDPVRTGEVLGLDPTDANSNKSVDIEGVYTDQTYIYLIAAFGGRGPAGPKVCLDPRTASYGCFRIQIFRSSSPLGTGIFNLHPLVAPLLPLNPAAYQRPFAAPDGTLRILGKFHNPAIGYSNSSNMLHFPQKPWRLISYPFPLSVLQFK